MTPLHAAARALALSQSGVDCFEDLEPEAQDALVENVRAVLGAIREPTLEMIQAGWLEVSCSHPEQADMQYGTETACWQAMLDTALSE